MVASDTLKEMDIKDGTKKLKTKKKQAQCVIVVRNNKTEVLVQNLPREIHP